MLFFLKYFSWLFVNPLFMVKGPDGLESGNIALKYHRGLKKTWVFIVASTVQNTKIDGNPARFFYALEMGDFNPDYYPVPTLIYTGDLGVENFSGGGINEFNRTYKVPFKASGKLLKNLISSAKKRWQGILHGYPEFKMPTSPFK